MEWRLLGDVGASVDGRSVTFKGHRHRAVLAYLLLDAGRTVTVDRIVDAVWGENPPKTARNTVQRFVADIRASLGTGAAFLVTVPNGYRLDADPGTVDLHRVDELLALDRGSATDIVDPAASDTWRSVINEFGGRPLSGVGEAVYAESARHRLAEIHANATESLAACEIDAGRHAAVLDMIEHFADQHPARDRACELLMLARYRSGRHTEALAGYDRFRRHLAEELGVVPAPAVEAMRMAILDHSVESSAGRSILSTSPNGAGLEQAAALRRPDRSPPASIEVVTTLPFPVRLEVHDAAPFAGRRREVEAIEQGLQGGARRASAFLLSGEPGIGKSRCAAEAATAAHASGANVLYGRCTPGFAADFQPWRAVLGHVLTNAPDALVRNHRLRFGDTLFTLGGVPVAGKTSPIGGSGDPDTVIGAAAALLEQLAGEAPLLVVLDDLQWADAASLRLLRYVVDNATWPIVLLGLFRGDEVDPNHPIEEWLASASRDTMPVRIELGGLDATEIRALVEDASLVGAGELDDTAVQALGEMTNGNPYFVIETIRSLKDEGSLAALSSGGDDPLAPSSVRRLLCRRVDRLGDDAAATLRIASAFGREFDLDVLAEALGRDEFEVLEHLEAAIAAHLIDDAPEGRDRFAFVHDLVHQSLAAEQSESRRCRAHSAIADAMEKRYALRLDAHVEEIAEQLLAAGDGDDVGRTFSYCRRAGIAAIGRFATDQAVRWFERALALLDRVAEPDDALRADVLVQLGTAQRYAASGGQRDTLIDAGRMALRNGNRDALVESVIQNWRAVNGAGWTLDSDHLEMCRAALDAVGAADSVQRARVLAALGLAMWEVEHTAEVKGVYEELTALARRLDDPDVLVRALDVALTARNYRPAPDELVAYAAELRSLYPTVQLDPIQFVSVVSSLATTAIQLADRDLLEHAMSAIDDEAERTGLPAVVNASLRSAAVRAWIDGSPDRFTDAIGAAFHFAAQYEGRDVAMLVFRAQTFMAMWMSGREGEVIDAGAFAPSRPTTRPLYRVIQTLAHLAAGRHDRAMQLLDAEVAAGFWTNDNHWTLQSNVMWADAAVQLGRIDACDVLVRDLAISETGMAGQFMSPLEPVDTAIGRMCVVSGRFDDAARHLDRAGAIADDWDAPWMRARVDLGRVELAMALTPGRSHDGSALRQRAVEAGYESIVRRLDNLDTSAVQ